MKINKQYFSLNHRVTIYVPSTNGLDRKVSQSIFTKRTNTIAGYLSATFGGASIEQIQGFYKSDAGKIVIETINKVTAFCDDTQLKQYSEDVLSLASEKCKEWAQESIGVEIDQYFYLIT
jgi:hypothetical protein